MEAPETTGDNKYPPTEKPGTEEERAPPGTRDASGRDWETRAGDIR